MTILRIRQGRAELIRTGTFASGTPFSFVKMKSGQKTNAFGVVYSKGGHLWFKTVAPDAFDYTKFNPIPGEKAQRADVEKKVLKYEKRWAYLTRLAVRLASSHPERAVTVKELRDKARARCVTPLSLGGLGLERANFYNLFENFVISTRAGLNPDLKTEGEGNNERFLLTFSEVKPTGTPQNETNSSIVTVGEQENKI